MVLKGMTIYILYRPANTAVTASLDNLDVVIEKEE
jgi:hypothetical protein